MEALCWRRRKANKYNVILLSLEYRAEASAYNSPSIGHGMAAAREEHLSSLSPSSSSPNNRTREGGSLPGVEMLCWRRLKANRQHIATGGINSGNTSMEQEEGSRIIEVLEGSSIVSPERLDNVILLSMVQRG